MPDNTGLLLLGLGALLFLGRGGAAKVDEDNRLVTRAAAPAFDLRSYIDGLFRDTIPLAAKLVYPADKIVTSSGVPAVSVTQPDIITPTTKVIIGGDGGETITASALAVIRSEQIKQQQFYYEANVQPTTWAATVEANRIESERQKTVAADLISKYRLEQANMAAGLNPDGSTKTLPLTRLEQENIAAGLNPDGSTKTLPVGMRVIVVTNEPYQPAININTGDGGSDDEGLSFGSTAGQDIVISDTMEDINVDFTPEYSETFEISGGMDFATEDEQSSVETVHEITAAYDIGF